MIEEFIDPDLDSLDGFDTSEVEDADVDDYEFTDSIGSLGDIDMDDVDADYLSASSPICDSEEPNLDEEPMPIKYRSTSMSGLSFTGGTHCMEYHCGCKNFEGTFGTVCTNCGHGYNKHF